MGEFLTGFVFGMLIAGIAIGKVADAAWRADAIERGYGQYCPDTGNWAWVGECGK